MISATQAYNYVQCPHRVSLDAFADPALKDEPNPFVELLWQQGCQHEEDVVKTLGITADMSVIPFADRERETRAAIAQGSRLIYQGRLTTGDLVGEPDLLARTDGGYVPGDIKSGAGFDGDEDDAKMKKSYAIQTAHYTNILETDGLAAAGREAFIIDRTGYRLPYPLMAPRGVRTPQSWWDYYQSVLAEMRDVLSGANPTVGALSSTCKLCAWYGHCKATLIAANDLTLIAELGRAKRDVLAPAMPTVRDFAVRDLDAFRDGKKTIFKGVGMETLVKYQARARLLSDPNAVPYLRQPVHLPVAEKEVFFDIEDDPFSGVVYLHGMVERLHGRPETAKYIPFFADGNTPAHEEVVFRQAWEYLQERVKDSTIYYYSKHERTEYKKLAARYPAVCDVDAIEWLFGLSAMVDLYTDVVKRATEWPCYDQSIKTLAQYCGFNWRDTHPSGAASIEWYAQWIKTGDPAIKTRILEYNEDDNLGTAVVADAVRQLELRLPA